MTPLRLRNLDVEESAPVEDWPAEAIETAIDRGTLADWARLADAIRRDPWGRVARVVETVAGWKEHYGVDALMQRVIAHAREEVTQAGRAAYAAEIRSWRRDAGMTLRELARAAGTSASRLSDYENAKVAPTTDVLGRLRHAARGPSARLKAPRFPL
jgi:DNA-binding transcriptional regulator YiaG